MGIHHAVEGVNSKFNPMDEEMNAMLF